MKYEHVHLYNYIITIIDRYSLFFISVVSGEYDSKYDDWGEWWVEILKYIFLEMLLRLTSGGGKKMELLLFITYVQSAAKIG